MIWKILIGGEGGAGKTAVINRYVNGTFSIDIKMTIGVAFSTRDIQIDGVSVRMQLWDLGGQDRFRFILPSYCDGARGGFVVYDASDLETLASTSEWFSMFNSRAPGMPIVLVGTKMDLLKNDGELNRVKEAASRIAVEHGCIGSIITSSKLGINVNEAVEMLVNRLLATARR